MPAIQHRSFAMIIDPENKWPFLVSDNTKNFQRRMT